MISDSHSGRKRSTSRRTRRFVFAGFFFALGVCLSACTAVAAELTFLDDLGKGKLEAKKNDALILVEFYAEENPLCEAIEQEMATNEPILSLLEPLVLVKLDATHGKSKMVARFHDIQAVPSFVLYHPTLGPLHQWKGGGAAGFYRNLKLGLDHPTPILERTELYASAPDAELAEMLGFFKVSIGQFGEAIPFFEDAERLDTERQCHAEIFDAAYNGFAKQQVTVEELCAAADRVLAIENNGRELLSIAAIMVYLTEEARAPARALPYVREAIERSQESTAPEELQVRTRLQPVYSLYVMEDAELALTQKLSGLSSGWETSPAALNNLAWWCAVHGIHLDKAEIWMETAVELTPESEGTRLASLLDTWAEVAWNDGDPNRAIALLTRAVKLDEGNTTLADRLTNYRERNEEN